MPDGSKKSQFWDAYQISFGNHHQNDGRFLVQSRGFQYTGIALCMLAYWTCYEICCLILCGKVNIAVRRGKNKGKKITAISLSTADTRWQDIFENVSKLNSATDDNVDVLTWQKKTRPCSERPWDLFNVFWSQSIRVLKYSSFWTNR